LISEYNLVLDGTAECGFKNCMERVSLSLVDYFDNWQQFKCEQSIVEVKFGVTSWVSSIQSLAKTEKYYCESELTKKVLLTLLLQWFY